MEKETLDSIDDYLSNRLSEAELDLFEERLICDPTLQIEVRRQIALREAFNEESAELLAQPQLSFFERIELWIVSPAWSYSLSIAVVALTVTLAAGIPDDLKQRSYETTIRNVEFTRSSDRPIVSAPAQIPFVLSIDVYGYDVEHSNLTVVKDGQVVVELFDVEANEEHLIHVNIEPLDAGDYKLILEPAAGNAMNVVLLVQ